MAQKHKWTKDVARADAAVNPVGPRWPSELMVKIFSSPGYSRGFTPLAPGMSVLDVGCLHGNNLRYFQERGLRLYGVDVNAEVLALAEENLAQMGCDAEFAIGENQALPFPDQSFDVVLSINTIHYQEGENGIAAAFGEFRRVLKDGGRLFVVTAGAEHEIRAKVERLGPFRHKVRDYDFRSGEVFAFFESAAHLSEKAQPYFADVQSGRLLEVYSTTTLDFYYCLARR